MTMYVDGRTAFHTTAAHFNTALPLAKGAHFVEVKAWDSAGNVYAKPLHLTVSTSTTAAPPQSATVKVFSNLQQRTGWGSCSACAGKNGAGPVAVFSMHQNQKSPSLSGHSTKFSTGGTHPYSDVIWWLELGGDNTATHFRYDVDFYLTSPQYAEILEFDMNQNENGRRFVYGTQCAIKTDHTWDVWDTAGNAWRSTGIPCAKPAAFKWHHLTWEIYRDSKSAHFVSVTLDGVKHYANKTYSSRAHIGPSAISVAFQMDGDFAMHSYSTWLDNLTVRHW